MINNIDIICRKKTDSVFKKWSDRVAAYLNDHVKEPKYNLKVQEDFADHRFGFTVSLAEEEVKHLKELSKKWDEPWTLDDDSVVNKLQELAVEAGNDTHMNQGEWYLAGWDLEPLFSYMFTILVYDDEQATVKDKVILNVPFTDDERRLLLTWAYAHATEKRIVPFQHLRNVYPELFNIICDNLEVAWRYPITDPCPPYLVEMTEVKEIVSEICKCCK